MDKSSGKSSAKRGKPFTKADPRIQRGKGPKPGAPNAGRPRDEWKARLQALASRDEVLAHVEQVLLAGPEHPYFPKALEYVTDHGYGRAASSLDVTSDGKALSGVVILPALDR